MLKKAIIIILVNCCLSSFSQDLIFSRNFETRKKSIPLEIINNNPSYFYVVRFNKVVHDITVERRSKPGAEIISFTPLKLDSVNAGWFDYENLDYFIFSSKQGLCFLFEKVLNTRRTVYLKIVDTTGKSSGFIELASLEGDKATESFNFICKQTPNNDILIIATKTALNGIIRRVAMLFSVEKRKMIWTKRLPLENDVEISSWNFSCNANNDLLYLQARSSLIGTETFGGVTRSIVRLDSLLFWDWKANETSPVSKHLNVWVTDYVRQDYIIADSHSVYISMLSFLKDTLAKDNTKEMIATIKIDAGSGAEIFNTVTPYDPTIMEQLTFYDGPEKDWYHKQHHFFASHLNGSSLYSLFERSEENYYKELLFRKTDLRSGQVLLQKIIPRKMFFFPGRTRFKHIVEPMLHFYGDSLCVFILEHPGNLKRNAGEYKYRSFKKITGLRGASIVAYSLNADGCFDKKEVFRNSDFELVPVKYFSSNQKDMVFYLNNIKYEKFAILQMYP